jgi:hypothetical protein
MICPPAAIGPINAQRAADQIRAALTNRSRPLASCLWGLRSPHEAQNPIRRPLSRAQLNDRDRARVPQLPPLAGAAVAPVFHAADDHPDTIRKGLPLALRRPNHRAPVWISRRATLLPKVVLGVRFRRRNRDRQFANSDCRLTCRHQDSRIAPGSCQWLSLDRKPQEMRSQNTCIKTLPPHSSHESIMRVGGVREDGERFNISRHQCAEDI